MAKHPVACCLFLETIIGYDLLNLDNGGWNIPSDKENCATGEYQQQGDEHKAGQAFHLCSFGTFFRLGHFTS